MESTSLYIVIPVHNRKQCTRDCLISLRRQSYKDFKVIIIDDGSTDGTSEMIKNDFPEVILLHGDGNLWWTGSINKGIRYVLNHCNCDDYILVLNDDLIVPPDYIDVFSELALKFSDTLIGSVIVDNNKRDVINCGGIRINWKTAKWTNVNGGKKLSSFPKGFFKEVSTLTGRGVLIPSKVFREIGLYNERHFLQHGDTELPIRAKKTGYKLIVSYDAAVFSLTDKNSINYTEEHKISDMKSYFWGIKSHTNIRDRFWFSFDTTSSTWKGIIFFMLDLARVIYHFIKRLRFIYSD